MHEEKIATNRERRRFALSWPPLKVTSAFAGCVLVALVAYGPGAVAQVIDGTIEKSTDKTGTEEDKTDVQAAPGVSVKFGDVSIGFGIGLRGMYTSTQNGAPNGTSRSNDFTAEDVSPNFTGVWKNFAIFLHYDIPCAGPGNCPFDIRVLDAVGEFNYKEEFNIWGGRVLPPTDRGNLAGRFYAETWEPPVVASNYPNIFGGRDNGIMAWGTVLDGRLGYSGGAFNGHDRAPGLSNQSDRLLFAGRLQWNFWDPEFGYNRPASYLGNKKMLSVGVATNLQSNGVGTAAKPGNLSIWSVDLLAEGTLPNGLVPTLTGAYYKYNLGGAIDCGSGEPGSTPCPSGYDNVGGQVAGHSFFVSGLLLFPQKFGYGQFQPFFRYQQFDRDVSNTTNKQTDVGLYYYIKGFDLRFVGMFSWFDDSRNPSLGLPQKSNQFLLGAQFQY